MGLKGIGATGAISGGEAEGAGSATEDICAVLVVGSTASGVPTSINLICPPPPP